MRYLSIALIIACSIPAHAAELGGYVVKADSATVFLDLGSASGVTLGQNFVVYTEGEELKHPITGMSLGRIESQLAKGHIEQIQEKFSVGTFEPKAADVKIKPGQKIRMLSSFTASAVPPPALVASAPVNHVPPAYPSAMSATNPISTPMVAAMPNGDRVPVWKSPAMDFEAIAFGMGDVDGDGKPEILFADVTHLRAYPQVGDWKPITEYEMPTTGSKILSIDAADLNKNGRAEIFVTYYNGAFDRVETLVLELKEKSFEKLAILPFMTRTFQDETGAVKLGSQQLMDDATFPFGGIYTVAYKDGKYVTDVPVKAKRVEWLYGFTLAKDQGGDVFPIFMTPSDRLRAQFKKKAWISNEAYGQTISRLRWKERDPSLMFRPRIISGQDNGNLRGLYVLDQTAGLGSLGSAFGYFTDSHLKFIAWDGLSLKTAWNSTPLGGYAADLAMVPDANGQPGELWVAVISSGGRLSVQKFQP